MRKHITISFPVQVIGQPPEPRISFFYDEDIQIIKGHAHFHINESMDNNARKYIKNNMVVFDINKILLLQID